MKYFPAGVGSTVEVAEIESLAKGTIIVGDGVGAPSTAAAGADDTLIVYDAAQGNGIKATNVLNTLTVASPVGNYGLTVRGEAGTRAIHIQDSAAANVCAINTISDGLDFNLSVAGHNFDFQAVGTSIIELAVAGIDLKQPTTVTDTTGNALVVGPLGTTNPTLKVDCSTGSGATGLDIANRAAGSGVYLTVISSGATEHMHLVAKGAGGVIGMDSTIEMSDAKDIKVQTTTGTKIGTATAQKIGFWNTTPVAQQAHISDPTGGGTVDAEARTAINSINALLATLGLTAAS